jgi:hypothetical protein
VTPPVAAGSGNRRVVTEGWSLVDALAAMFVVEPEPAVNRAPQVTCDDNREELALQLVQYVVQDNATGP